MNHNQDRRIRYTKQALHNALISLLQSKKLYSISVRELCETADVNRSTFYMHYRDINDLLQEMEQEVYLEVAELFHDAEDSQNIFRLLEYVKSHKEIYSVLMLQDQSEVSYHFTAILHAHYQNYLKQKNTLSNTIDDVYLYEFWYTGILGVIRKWVNRDCQDDARRVAAVIWNILSQR